MALARSAGVHGSKEHCRALIPRTCREPSGAETVASMRVIRALAVLAALLICLPVALITTILLVPLWSWIERTYGIESIGHSGPAGWCYAFVYSTFVVITLVCLCLVARYRASPGDSATK